MIKQSKDIRVLIADDDRLTRSVLRMILQEAFYRVVAEAADGERAIEACLMLRPDVAFIDIDMPKFNGHDVVQRVRDDHPHIKVVMISSLATLDNVQQAMRSGANSFVVKPFNAVKVIEALKNCLKGMH
ncbi:MAG TPA: response regulator [Paucimonas sp.]|nr:response regulator [Paucimonas sp.]